MSKQKILDVAFELFSKGHYNSVSILEISQKAGIKKPSIYAHFDSKENLFLTIFENESSKIYKKIQELVNKDEEYDLKIMLSKLLIESINYIRDNSPVGGFWAYLLFVPPYDLPEKIISSINNFKILIKDLMSKIIQNKVRKEDIMDEDVESIIYAYYCLLQGNILMGLNSDIFNMDNVYKSWNYFWNGVENKF